jgi:hypothetical protein
MVKYYKGRKRLNKGRRRPKEVEEEAKMEEGRG